MRTAANPAFACYNLRKSAIPREMFYPYFLNLTVKRNRKNSSTEKLEGFEQKCRNMKLFQAVKRSRRIQIGNKIFFKRLILSKFYLTGSPYLMPQLSKYLLLKLWKSTAFDYIFSQEKDHFIFHEVLWYVSEKNIKLIINFIDINR